MRKGKTEQFDMAARFLFPAAVFIGNAVMLMSLVGTGAVIAVPAAAGVVVIILMQLGYERSRSYLAVAATAAALLYICVTFVFLRTGIAVTLNQLIDSWQQIHPRNYVTFNVNGSHTEVCQILFLTALAVAGAGLVTAAIRKGSKAALAVSAAGAAVVILLFQQVLAWQYILAAALSMALWLFAVSGRSTGDIHENMLAGELAVMIRVIPLTLVITAISALAFFHDGYAKPALLKNAESAACQAVDFLRYGGEYGTGMPQGRVYKAGELKLSEEPVLKVTMQNPDSYYLRGFVGGMYEDGCWQEIPAEKLYASTDMFYWLHRDGFYGYMQLANASSQTEAVPLSEMSVENTGASRKYIYAPYETSSETGNLDENAAEDSNISADGLRGSSEYSLMVAPNLVTRFPQTASGLSHIKSDDNTYIRDESYYNQFVYSSYMDVPEDIRTLLSEYLGSYDISPGQIHFDYQMAKQNITYFMTSKMKYDEKTEKTGRERDFITTFLSASKTGYSIHYASAATMMFRYYGIPARYVEGYLITKEDAASAGSGDTLVLDGTHAHAWVEYYHDGVGWLPFEVTPSYLSVMPSAEKMQDISGIVGQDGQQPDMDIHEDDNFQDEQMNEGIDEYWLQSSLLKTLVICALLLLILIIAFAIWIRRGLKKRDMVLASFEDEDTAQGICNIFRYTERLLLAWGLDPAKGSLLNQKSEVVRLMGDAAAEDYDAVVELYQEAKYSGHDMNEEARSKVRGFKDKVYDEMWSRAGTMTRLQYKYMYFF